MCQQTLLVKLALYPPNYTCRFYIAPHPTTHTYDTAGIISVILLPLPAHTRMCECGAFRSIAHRTSKCVHGCRSFLDISPPCRPARTGESSNRTSLEWNSWKSWVSTRIFKKCGNILRNFYPEISKFFDDFFEDFSKISKFSQRCKGFPLKRTRFLEVSDPFG